MAKYRKKPVAIEAVLWTGNNQVEILEFVTNNKQHFINDTVDGKEVENLYIDTLEGRMKADIGDWIIKGVKGEFYPCKPDIFELTYDKVDRIDLIDLDPYAEGLKKFAKKLAEDKTKFAAELFNKIYEEGDNG